MKSHTVYKTFETARRREMVRITPDVQRAVDEASILEGMALVSAMHITAGVWVNDDEPGLHHDVLEWLQPDWWIDTAEGLNEFAQDRGVVLAREGSFQTAADRAGYPGERVGTLEC